MPSPLFFAFITLRRPVVMVYPPVQSSLRASFSRGTPQWILNQLTSKFWAQNTHSDLPRSTRCQCDIFQLWSALAFTSKTIARIEVFSVRSVSTCEGTEAHWNNHGWRLSLCSEPLVPEFLDSKCLAEIDIVAPADQRAATWSIILIETEPYVCIEIGTHATLFFMVRPTTTMTLRNIAAIQLIPSHAVLDYSIYLRY